MLSKINRLKKKKDFEKVFKKGRGFKEKLLYLKAAKNNLAVSRFGFVVGKNFSKKSVARAKIKRQLREITRKKINELKKGIDAVVVVMPGFTVKNFQELEQVITNLFKKSEVAE